MKAGRLPVTQLIEVANRNPSVGMPEPGEAVMPSKRRSASWSNPMRAALTLETLVAAAKIPASLARAEIAAICRATTLLTLPLRPAAAPDEDALELAVFVLDAEASTFSRRFSNEPDGLDAEDVAAVAAVAVVAVVIGNDRADRAQDIFRLGDAIDVATGTRLARVCFNMERDDKANGMPNHGPHVLSPARATI